MIDVKSTKNVLMMKPQLKNNGAFADNTYVDTLGYNHLRVKIITGFMDEALGSTNTSTPLYLEECDTADGTYTSLATTPGAALSSVLAATDDNKIFCIDLNLQGRKRYIRVNAPTAGNGTTGVNACIIGELSRPSIHPSSATGAGFAEWVQK